MNPSQTPAEPTIFVVDDDDAVRDALQQRLKLEGFRVRAFRSAAALLAGLEAASSGCILLDIRMPGRSGLELQAELTERANSLPVIIITGHGDVPAARAAFRAGAVDFLEKPLHVPTLLSAIETALVRGRQRRDQLVATGEMQARLKYLTAREREILELIYDGYQNREIAQELRLSVRTIEVHKAHIMDKLRVGNLAELIRLIRQYRDGVRG